MSASNLGSSSSEEDVRGTQQVPLSTGTAVLKADHVIETKETSAGPGARGPPGAAEAAPQPGPVVVQPEAEPQAQAEVSRRWSDVPLEELRARLADFAQDRNWDQYHTPRNLLLALVGEAGELCELFQWRPEAEAGPGLPGFSDKERVAVEEELADVLLYLVRLADRCGIDLGRAALSKMRKNAVKYPADKCHGSSAKYTAYDEEQGRGQGSGKQES